MKCNRQRRMLQVAVFWTVAVAPLIVASGTSRAQSAATLAPGPARLEPAQLSTPESRILEAARRQVGVTIIYDGSYVVIPYPGGDLPRERGVCTDVIIRALRDALGIDLQRLVHEDMRAAFDAYPKLWGLTRPDRSIDHRRVPNLQTWLDRHAQTLVVNTAPEEYRPADLVTSMLPGNLPHIMIVSDRRAETGVPLVIHNIGAGTREEDCLFRYPLTGHYRLRFDPAPDELR